MKVNKSAWVGPLSGLYYKHILTIVNDASTINVIDDASLALDSIVNYDRKWRYNLERHFDDTRRVNYDRNTFIIQATGCALLTKIRLGWKCFHEPNTLAYFVTASVTKSKRFWSIGRCPFRQRDTIFEIFSSHPLKTNYTLTQICQKLWETTSILFLLCQKTQTFYDCNLQVQQNKLTWDPMLWLQACLQ